jgi:fatty-acyl-CoA synthase
VLPWVEAEAVDGDDNPLPAGTEGVLRMRTAHQAYFDGPPRAGSADDLPWFYPGDRGSVQPDGMMCITGRVSELINIGGVKIAPESIERAMTGHRAVRDCAAAGVPNARGMEEVQAVVVLREPATDAELVAWGTTKFPQTPVKRVIFVESIPRNAAGKIVRGDVVRLLDAANPSQTGTT